MPRGFRLLCGSFVLEEFVTVTFALFLRGLFAELSETLEKFGDFFFLPGFAQGLDEPIDGGLILGIQSDGFAALFDGELVLAGLHVELGEYGARCTERGLQGDGFLRGAHSELELRRTRIN